MRRTVRNFSAALIISSLAYWLFTSSFWGGNTTTIVYDSQCNQIEWYNAPAGFGRREWHPSWEGSALSDGYRQWMAMTDTDRMVALSKCGKERPTE